MWPWGRPTRIPPSTPSARDGLLVAPTIGLHDVQQDVTEAPPDHPGGLPPPAHPGGPAADQGQGEGHRHLDRSGRGANGGGLCPPLKDPLVVASIGNYTGKEGAVQGIRGQLLQ